MMKHMCSELSKHGPVVTDIIRISKAVPIVLGVPEWTMWTSIFSCVINAVEMVILLLSSLLSIVNLAVKE